MKHLAGLTLTPDQHRQLVALCASAADFPATYDDWLQLVRAGEAEAASAGQPIRPLEVEVDEFAQWCRLVGIVPCIDALKAYAIVQRLEPTDTLYATTEAAHPGQQTHTA